MQHTLDKIETSFAKIISYLLHPLLMPTYGTLILYALPTHLNVFTTLKQILIITSFTFSFTFLMPVLNALFLKRMGYIQSLQMETPEERRVPYLSTAILYFIQYYLVGKTDLPSLFKVLMLGATLSVILTLIINLKWKISAHMVGIGGLIGAFAGIAYRIQIDIISVIVALFFISGIIAFARLKLNAHTQLQIYAGFGIGFLSELLLIIFL